MSTFFFVISDKRLKIFKKFLKSFTKLWSQTSRLQENPEVMHPEIYYVENFLTSTFNQLNLVLTLRLQLFLKHAVTKQFSCTMIPFLISLFFPFPSTVTEPKGCLEVLLITQRQTQKIFLQILIYRVFIYHETFKYCTQPKKEKWKEQETPVLRIRLSLGG